MPPTSSCATCGWPAGVTSRRSARQLARTEDKLEQVLQEVERLQEQLADSERASASNGTRPPAHHQVVGEQVNPVEQLVRAPVAAVEFANLLLTRDDAHDRRHAEGRRVDAPQDDAVPLPLAPAAPTRCRSCSCSR